MENYLTKFENTSILKQALVIAEKSNHHFQIGVVIFKGKRILSKGFNSIRFTSKIPPMYKEWHNSLHAEQQALLNCQNTQGASILIVRLRHDRDYGLAKPCEMCYGMIIHRKIKNIYYTTNEGTIERIKL